MLVVSSDIREVERRTHGLVAVCEARAPRGGSWKSLFVQRGSVTLGELGDLPCRTCSVTVLGFTDQIPDVLNYLSIMGGWIRLRHRVIRVDGSIAGYNWLGYFRVSKLELHPLDGTITITGEDAGALIRDFALPTLKDGEVKTSGNFAGAAATMLSDPLAYIPSWWSTDVDQGTAPFVHPKARVQLEGSRVDAVHYLLDNLKYKVACPPDASAVFRFVPRPITGNPAIITIRGGQLGNLVETVTTQDRSGIANTGVVKYTTQTVEAGDRVRTRQRRLVEYYEMSSNADWGQSDAGCHGPFGFVTMDVNSTNVDTDAEAIAAADLALRDTLTQARDFTVTVSPIYGIEPGDVIRLEQREGTGMRGIVVGGTIGLTASDDWTLTVRAFAPVGYWGSQVRRTFVTDSSQLRDAVEWVDQTNPNIDTTGSTFTGWDIWGGALREGGSRLDAIADGTALTDVESDVAFPWPSNTNRARVRFHASPKDYDLYCRAYIKVNGVKHYSKGYAMVLAEANAEFEADITLVTTGTFTVGLEMSDNTAGAPLAADTEVYITGMDIVVAGVISI